MIEAMFIHRQQIEKKLALLNPRLNVDDEPVVKTIDEVTTELGKLETEIDVYLKATAPK